MNFADQHSGGNKAKRKDKDKVTSDNGEPSSPEGRRSGPTKIPKPKPVAKEPVVREPESTEPEGKAAEHAEGEPAVSSKITVIKKTKGEVEQQPEDEPQGAKPKKSTRKNPKKAEPAVAPAEESSSSIPLPKPKANKA